MELKFILAVICLLHFVHRMDCTTYIEDIDCDETAYYIDCKWQGVDTYTTRNIHVNIDRVIFDRFEHSIFSFLQFHNANYFEYKSTDDWNPCQHITALPYTQPIHVVDEENSKSANCVSITPPIKLLLLNIFPFSLF